MNETPHSDGPLAGASEAEIHSALFANLVLQQTQMALMFLGQIPHPESGEKLTDLDAAQMFISQLEMLTARTRGNLSPQEEQLLRQSLTSARMAFVEAARQAEAGSDAGKMAAATPAGDTAKPAAESASDAAKPEEARPKFTKKY